MLKRIRPAREKAQQRQVANGEHPRETEGKNHFHIVLVGRGVLTAPQSWRICPQRAAILGFGIFDLRVHPCSSVVKSF